MDSSSDDRNAAAIERMRLAALDDLHLVDTPPEERFDRITRLAREIFNVPVAQINLVDDVRQFTKSQGSGGSSADTERADSFCEVTIQSPGLLVVNDAERDERFASRATVTGDRHIRFYAGRPLSLGGDLRVGALCLIDVEPREMDDVQLGLLDEMGLWVERELRDTAPHTPPAPLPIAPVVDSTVVTAPAEEDGNRLAFTVAAASLPLRKPGSDFFAWNEVDGALEITVADVMGKGGAAAAVALAIRDLLAEHAGEDVSEAIGDVNMQLSDELRKSGTFATLLHARIALDSGIVDYVDAGHGLTLVVRGDMGVERLDSTGFPLGLIRRGVWEQRSTILQPGDTLVSFTDGLLNLFDGTLESLEKVVDLVRTSQSPQQVVDSVLALARRGRARDDLTIIAVTCS